MQPWPMQPWPCPFVSLYGACGLLLQVRQMRASVPAHLNLAAALAQHHGATGDPKAAPIERLLCGKYYWGIIGGSIPDAGIHSALPCTLLQLHPCRQKKLCSTSSGCWRILPSATECVIPC